MAAAKIGIETIRIPSSHIILISDIHFGRYNSSEEWQESMSKYFYEWFIPLVKRELAKNPDAVLCCLGDVYQDRNAINIDVNNLVIDIFEELASIIPCYILNGNHDLSKSSNKGNSSLRSLSNINNLTLIRDTTMLQFVEGRKNVAKVIAVPYLGECALENKKLVEFSTKADFAFMHTEISKMKFDNGMTIVGAVDAEKFAGRVISGHIHRRQETDKVVYIGSPYHLDRGDIGDVKGIYTLDLTTKELSFTPNDFSPIFTRVPVKEFMEMDDATRHSVLDNNYVDIIMEESDTHMFKKSDIYDLINSCNAKKAEPKVRQSKKSQTADSSTNADEIVELSLEELINNSIDSLTDVSDEFKADLHVLSDNYYNAAKEQMGI